VDAEKTIIVVDEFGGFDRLLLYRLAASCGSDPFGHYGAYLLLEGTKAGLKLR